MAVNWITRMRAKKNTNTRPIGSSCRYSLDISTLWLKIMWESQTVLLIQYIFIVTLYTIMGHVFWLLNSKLLFASILIQGDHERFISNLPMTFRFLFLFVRPFVLSSIHLLNIILGIEV